MKGFEIIFIAPRLRRYGGRPVLDAIEQLAESQGIARMTRRDDVEGIGANDHAHSLHFFEPADEPQELMFVLDGDQADRLVRAVEEAGINVFCVRRQIDFWQFGEN